jgi:hypothetical protein
MTNVRGFFIDPASRSISVMAMTLDPNRESDSKGCPYADPQFLPNGKDLLQRGAPSAYAFRLDGKIFHGAWGVSGYSSKRDAFHDVTITAKNLAALIDWQGIDFQIAQIRRHRPTVTRTIYGGCQ